MAGHELDVFVPRESVAVFILDSRIREVHVSVVARQVVLASPARDLLRFPVRPPIAVLLASIPLVEEPLVVPLELVVQVDAVHSAAVFADALFGAQVGAINLRVVCQLARLPEARVERLTGLPGALLPLVPIPFEQVPAAICQRHGAVVRAERQGAYQTLSCKVKQAFARVPAAVVEIALGYHTKSADGGKHLAFGAVDLVHPIAFSHGPTLTSSWQVEILREHISRVAIGRMIAFAAPATAAAAPVAEVVAVAII